VSKNFMLTLLAVVAVLGGIFWFSSKKSEAPANGKNTVQASSHVQGAGNKNVTLIEYGDFQCPACGGFYPIIKQIKAKYGDDIKFQFRNFPLVQIHPNAMAAHRAAEAADKQGKFFEMHDMLYERQPLWTTSTSVTKIFDGYAEELGLEMTKYRQDVASSAANDTINADIKEGQKIGANSTPTFVLNGRKLDQNPRTLEDFNKLIDEAIAAKQQN